MTELPKIRIGISAGDPNGIGIEIILKAFHDKRLFDFFTPIVFANSENLINEKKRLDLSTSIFALKNLETPKNGQLNVINTWQKPFRFTFGKEEVAAGAAALSSLVAATTALKNSQIEALVTAPIHKKSIQSDSFHFPGHTDYLNKELEGESLMFMISERLRVALVTHHIPLKEVTTVLTKQIITDKIKRLSKSLIQDFGIQRPKIAVLGINPHTGDQGVIGNEDDLLLRPLLKELFDQGQLVFGPYAADGFFGSQTYTRYDAVLAMYHDQGLIPFKTLSFGKGVNFTAGLNRVRTSPDHGTAFDIAGQGVADPSSFIEALFSAREIFQKRSSTFSN
ncbi:MAG: 4-hydroxythreonine-4-phosphate dehydrogenase PdxA [Bacteroidetes bacterium]|nr:4-hydroxythreonine-4-phosphate dehydrogenase PdxA [Bacteroidota bacterium]